MAASLLARLAVHLDRHDFREAAVAAVRAYGKSMTRHPRAFAKSLAVVDFLTQAPVELALVGRKDDPAFSAMRTAMGDVYLPNRIIATTDRVDGTAGHPLLAGKQTVNGGAALYVCQNFACQRPLTDDSAVIDALRSASSGIKAGAHGTKLRGTSMDGSATSEGTARYAVRFVNQPRPSGRFEYGFTPFGTTELTSSRLGFGCYRIHGGDPDHESALQNALQSGVNVIDTSTNYMDGESERLVGSVLRESIKNRALSRDEIIVVSKIGYVQGQSLEQAKVREQTGRAYPEMVKYGEDLWHCIHPEFLHDQLEMSLDRLGLATLDVCLLHNPEYFLSEAARSNANTLADRREIFYRRVTQAFAFLETQVEAGRIRWYGVSSNTVTGNLDDPENTSLSDLLSAAVNAAAARKMPRHHFAVLQCPMNLFESGAWTRRNTGPNHDQTVLQFAQQERLAILVNRPLNAMPTSGTGVLRLADFPLEGEAVDIDAALRAVQALEEEYRAKLAPAIPHGGEGTKPVDFFNWADELKHIRSANSRARTLGTD